MLLRTCSGIVIALALGCGNRAAQDDADKIDLAKLEAKKLAFECFPQWAAGHPSKMCPDKLDELYEYMSTKGGMDPWGQPFRMYCGENLPTGARGLAIASSGPDRKEGTADDIKSWEK